MFIPIRQQNIPVEVTYTTHNNGLLLWLGDLNENENCQVPKAYLNAVRFSIWMKIQNSLDRLRGELMDDISLDNANVIAKEEISKMICEGGHETDQWLIDFYKRGEENNEEKPRSEAVDTFRGYRPGFGNIKSSEPKNW